MIAYFHVCVPASAAGSPTCQHNQLQKMSQSVSIITMVERKRTRNTTCEPTIMILWVTLLCSILVLWCEFASALGKIASEGKGTDLGQL